MTVSVRVSVYLCDYVHLRTHRNICTNIHTYIHIDLQDRAKHTDGTYHHRSCYETMLAAKASSEAPVNADTFRAPARKVKVQACPGCGQPVYEDQVCVYT